MVLISQASGEFIYPQKEAYAGPGLKPGEHQRRRRARQFRLRLSDMLLTCQLSHVSLHQKRSGRSTWNLQQPP
jgi:hypothetical protein